LSGAQTVAAAATLPAPEDVRSRSRSYLASFSVPLKKEETPDQRTSDDCGAAGVLLRQARPLHHRLQPMENGGVELCQRISVDCTRLVPCVSLNACSMRSSAWTSLHEVESIIPFTQSLVQDLVCEALNTRGQSEQMLGQERFISQFPQPQIEEERPRPAGTCDEACYLGE
jgi:hypothetical protein